MPSYSDYITLCWFVKMREDYRIFLEDQIKQEEISSAVRIIYYNTVYFRWF